MTKIKKRVPKLLLSVQDVSGIGIFQSNSAIIDARLTVLGTNICIVIPEHCDQIALACIKRKNGYNCFVALPNARQWKKMKQTEFVRFARTNGFYEQLPVALKKVKTRDGAIVPASGDGWALL